MVVVRRVVPALALAATSVLAAACSGSGDDATPDSTRALPVSGDDVEPVVAVDDSPFCRTMLGIDDDDMSLDEIVASYVDVTDDVPDEIRPDFDVVLERLVAVTGDDDAAADTLADEVVEASRFELAAFIDRRCRGTVSNPLPPPTVPE
ncbi:MAG: hypothetical protein WD225_00250 [Ilumatobacteraceae bacterium]